MEQPVRNDALDALDPRELGRDLKAARVRRGLTQEQAAQLIGVARTTLVAIEQGIRRILPTELVGLAHGYGRDVSEFVRRRPSVDAFQPQFRGPAAPKADSQELITRQVQIFEDLCRNYLELEELTASPLVRHYPAEYRTAGLPAEEVAEAIALEERNRLRLGDGPVPLLRDVLENDIGLRVFYLDLPSEYSEIYAYSDQLGGCLAANRRHPVERRRWSLVHGLGHFLAHRRRSVVEVDGGYQRRPDHERFVDAYTGFFLMPTTGLTRRFNDVRQSSGKVTLVDLCVLAHTYGVSMEALTRRLEDLRLISAGKWDELKRSGLKVSDLKAQAGVDAFPDRMDRYPLRYRLLAVDALDRGLITEGQFARFLEVSRVEARRQAELLRQVDDEEEPAETNLNRHLVAEGPLGEENEHAERYRARS